MTILKLGLNKLPTWARTTLYVLAVTATLFGWLTPQTLNHAIDTATQLTTLLAALTALTNITPKEPDGPHPTNPQ
jgi:hypothetical protein